MKKEKQMHIVMNAKLRNTNYEYIYLCIIFYYSIILLFQQLIKFFRLFKFTENIQNVENSNY